MTEKSTVGTGARCRQRPHGTGSLFRVGRRWYVEFSDRPGHRVQESSRSTKKSVAEQLLRRRLMELEQGRFRGAKAERVLMGDLFNAVLDDYLINRRRTIRDTEIRLRRHLAPFFGCSCEVHAGGGLRLSGGVRAVDVTSDTLRSYLLGRRDRGAADGTVILELALVRRAFSLAVRARNLREAPYIEMPRPAPPRTGFLEYEQYRRLRDELPDHVKPIAGVGYFTGIRLAEIRFLLWEQVDWLNRELRLNPGETKNEEGRTIPLVSELFELLRMHSAKSQGSPYVFPSRKRPDRPITDFRKAWEDACVRTGLGRMERREDGRQRYVGLTFHDLRRSAIMNMERSGVPRSVAMKISGHRTESTYRRYAIVNSRDLKEAAVKIDRYLTKQSNVLYCIPGTRRLSSPASWQT